MINTCIKYLEKNALFCSDKTAIVDQSRQVNFKELRINALKISSSIDTKHRNQPIGVYFPKSISAIECFMGILYSGNFYVPLDVKSPVERLKKVISNLNPVVIFTNSEYVRFLSENITDPNINIVNIDATHETFEYLYSEIIEEIIDTDPVYCIYTSGSTGEPKGVLIPHRGVIDYIDWAETCYSITTKDKIGNQAPLFFDNSTLDIYLMLKTGATLFLINDFLFAFPHRLIDYVAQNEINTIFWVPTVMKMVMNNDALLGKTPALEKILFAGEVMPTKVLNYWKRHIPDALYSNLYGPTEITVDCTYYNVDRDFSDTESLPIGKACFNSGILVLNENNEMCMVDEPGEICVRGSSLALGYWNNFSKTQEVFQQNPLNKMYPEKIYRTGDLVKINSRNEILYIGRKDSQIKHLGYRIELGEIETAIQSIHGINNMCVMYDHKKAEIILFYETTDSTIDDNFVRKYLLTRLPKYMIPTRVYCLDEIPLNANGKVDRVFLVNKYVLKD